MQHSRAQAGRYTRSLCLGPNPGFTSTDPPKSHGKCSLPKLEPMLTNPPGFQAQDKSRTLIQAGMICSNHFSS
jgi:hypothetical protein